ncbi:MAG: hypothetical protein AB1422_00360 [bacterium]
MKNKGGNMLLNNRKNARLFCFFICLIIFTFIYPLLSIGENLPPKNIHNVRLQFRKDINGNRINNENNFQVTYFSNLSHNFFLFANTEVIYEGTEYYSSNSELNISRPFSPYSEWGKSLSWITRLQMETHKRLLLSFGTQWYITDIPFFINAAKKYKVKVFLQVFPIKSHNEEGTVDVYLYYQLPLRDQFAYIRGYGRYFSKNKEGDDYKLLVHDIIFPINNTWDVYGRYSYYNRLRNNGVGLGIRYLLRF